MLQRPVGRIKYFSGILFPGLEAEDDVGGLALVLEKRGRSGQGSVELVARLVWL